jgi:hypothetical protein
MDKGKRALKRAFPGDDGMTGCVKIDLLEEDPCVGNIMESVAEKFSGKFEFVPFIMGGDGLQSVPCELTIRKLGKSKSKPTKIYAMAKGKGIHMKLFLF